MRKKYEYDQDEYDKADKEDRVTPSDSKGHKLPLLEADIQLSIQRVRSMAMHSNRLPAIQGYQSKAIGADEDIKGEDWKW